MKKLFCFLMAVALLMSASFALAEEPAQTHEPTQFPNIDFGADPVTALEVFNAGWSSGFSYSRERTMETVTLSNGTEIVILTLPAVASEDPGRMPPMTAKLFFSNSRLVAAVQEIVLPEGADTSTVKTFISQSMNSLPGRLDPGKIGLSAELLGEAAHLENGQDAWQYTFSAAPAGEEAPAVLQAMVTVNPADNCLYLAEFPVSGVSGKAAAQDPANLEGFDRLTAEEQKAVQLYAEYLQKQQNETLAQYIDFLLKKHP